MLQNALIDLLHYNPAQIKLFGFNLFFAPTNEYSHSDYRYYSTSRLRELSGHAFHNLVNNYDLTKLLYDQGYIEVDDALKSVLDLGRKTYMTEMENFFIKKTEEHHEN